MSSPRGSVEMEVRIDPDLTKGLVFTTYHFPHLVDINLITNDAWDPRSGTAEFKAASVRISKLPAGGNGSSGNGSGGDNERVSREPVPAYG